MTAPYFRSAADGLVPDDSAHAPWSTDMLHGRLIGGLAARTIEARIDDVDRRVARFTVDLFRPAGMTAVSTTATTVRRGRRIEVVDVVVTSDGHDVARATALVLATGTEPPGTIWEPASDPWPDPETVPAGPDEPDSAWHIRTVAGGFDSAERSRLWTNDTERLVDDEPMSAFVRAAVSGDLACPIANSGDAGLHYINADYTLTLARYPVGEWIGLEVAQRIAADGIALASCTLVDVRGPFATSTGSSITTTPLGTPHTPDSG